MDPDATPPPAPVSVNSTASSPSSGQNSSPTSAQKLRLMCSYGGHIVPRPLDKTLCYAGGETRIVAIDRRNVHSLSTVTSQLSKSLMDGKQFSLKYQLPNHDLDSLISISTEEDLANMIDEYDRLAGGATPSRLRFFLFPLHDLHDPTSEDWFIDALRNVGVVAKGRFSDSGEGQGDCDGKSPTAAGGGVGDSPLSLQESIPLEKNSSFGSTGSSTSNSNSPAIRGGGGDDNLGVRLPADFKIALPMVDSIGSYSDSSTPSPNYSPQCIAFQDASNFVETKVVSANVVETESNTSDRSPRGDMLTQVPVPGYILTKPMEQQQQQQQQQQMTPSPAPQTTYIHQQPPHHQSHYLTHQYYPSSVPVASYATMYNPYVQPQQTLQYQVNKPQQLYMMSMGQAQSPYDLPIQNTLATASAVPPTMVAAAPMAYEGYNPGGPTKMFLAPAQQVTVPSDAFPTTVSAAPLESTSYIGEFEDPLHAQIYKTQPPGPPLPSQLQVATNAAATVMLSETLAQLHVDNAKH